MRHVRQMLSMDNWFTCLCRGAVFPFAFGFHTTLPIFNVHLRCFYFYLLDFSEVDVDCIEGFGLFNN